MMLRGNLFLRMFIGFWLMTIAILGSWSLASNYFESQPLARDGAEHRPNEPPHRFMLRTIYKLEHMGTVALAREVATIRQEFGISIYLVTPSDTGLNGRNPSDEVIEIARQSGAGYSTGYAYRSRIAVNGTLQ
jgi:hypothetical protein